MRFAINIRKQHDAEARDSAGSGMLFRFDPASVIQPNDPFLFRHIVLVSVLSFQGNPWRHLENGFLAAWRIWRTTTSSPAIS
jgi:hypothetical protein